MNVSIRYFARLREEAGTGRETVVTEATTVEGLWKQVAAEHGFTLNAEQIKAAQDEEFCAWNAPLAENCEVAFMPPVAGG